MKIKQFMVQVHKDCDLLFAKAENAAAKLLAGCFITFSTLIDKDYTIDDVN